MAPGTAGRLQKCKVFDRVHGVSLSSTAGPNAEWAQSKKLSNHRHLYLHVRETADGVLDTNGITILEWAVVTLSLKGTMVTDEGLAQLSHLTNLKYLWLDGTAVTDLGLARFSGLTKLKLVFLGDQRSLTRGLKNLRRHCRIAKSAAEDHHATATYRSRSIQSNHDRFPSFSIRGATLP